MQATKKKELKYGCHKEIIITCFSAFSDSSSIQASAWSDESHALIVSSPYSEPVKREGLVHNIHGVKTEQVTAEGLVEFTHEVFAHWNLLRNNGMP